MVLLVDKFVILILHSGVEALIIRLRLLPVNAELVGFVRALLRLAYLNVVRIVVERRPRLLK